MAIRIPSDVINATTGEELGRFRSQSDFLGRERDIDLDPKQVTNAALEDLLQAAQAQGAGRLVRATESILRARQGDFDKPIPSIDAFQGVLQAFLQHDLQDGWIYVTGPDGNTYPELVTDIKFDDGRNRGATQQPPSVSIITLANSVTSSSSQSDYFGARRKVHSFMPQDVTKRRVADALVAKGIYKETPALRAEYDRSMERHQRTTMDAFAKQFRFTGSVFTFGRDDYRRQRDGYENRKVIHDLEANQYPTGAAHVESFLFDSHPTANGLGAVPEHPVVRLFDLTTHEFYWVHADQLTPYEYDHSLRDKLILPASHRDLLDVLTSNLDAFIDDIIEGKSAGNVVLCKGIPGVGKTLTAEVYSELIERPLYSIHTGSLGTTADSIQKNLKEIFQRAQRWNCVLLLDEADVFVVQRAQHIEQNAIVAEFLRVLEYFDGLLFMTTNRPDDIDEAIISRCAAIIHYAPPTPEHAAAIWRVMAQQYGTTLDDGLLKQLVATFPEIAPRDIKMLFRLALRVATANNEPLTIDTFRRCAMFRAVKIAPAA